MGDINLLNHTKTILVYLMRVESGSKTIYTLNDEFCNYVGREIPFYELGYRYLETFLQSIPDTLLVDPITKIVQLPFVGQRTPLFVPYSNVYDPKQIYGKRLTNGCHCCQFMPPPFMSQPLPWHRINYSYSQTQSRQQDNYSQSKFRTLSLGKLPQSSKPVQPIKITNPSGKGKDKAVEEVLSVKTQNITFSSSQSQAEGDLKLLSPRENGDGKCVSPNRCNNRQEIVVNFVTTVTKSENVVTFSKSTNDNGRLMPMTVASPKLDDANVFDLGNDNQIDKNVVSFSKSISDEEKLMPLTAASTELDVTNILDVPSDDPIDKIVDDQIDKDMVLFSKSISDKEKLMPMTVASTELDDTNVFDFHNDDQFYLSTDEKENVIVTSVPPLDDPEQPTSEECFSFKYMSGNSSPVSGIKAVLSNSSCSIDHGIDSELDSMLPAYTEKDMIKYDDNMNGLLEEYTDDSDSSGDDLPIKKPITTLDNEAVPFLPDNDFIQLIGSKFTSQRYGIKLETTNIETVMEVGGFYELYISEVNSPYKFWFQLVDDNSSPSDELQEQINNFYNSTSCHQSQDIIEKRHMIKGYPCAALYDRIWHRAEFVEKPNGAVVKLFFVDFGTVSEVSVNDIRYLLYDFCKLPKLCLRGTLDFIKPTDYRWSREATLHFIDMIGNLKLVAGVSEINAENNSARIYVMDTSKNININYKMVLDGYAFPDDPRERYQKHIADALPTFESLETGKYPSLYEAGNLSEQGYDPDKMFEYNVNDEVDCYIPQYMSNEEAIETMEKYYREKEKAKEMASKKDATIFNTFFGKVITNPFLNGMSKVIQLRQTNKVSSLNPFSNDIDDLTYLPQ